MNIFSWLLQRTPDGATNLQVLLLSFLLLVVLYFTIVTIDDVYREVYKPERKENDKNDL